MAFYVLIHCHMHPIPPSVRVLQWDKDTPTTLGGAYGIYFVADPSYGESDGGFGNNTAYPQNGNSIVTMCNDHAATCRG